MNENGINTLLHYSAFFRNLIVISAVCLLSGCGTDQSGKLQEVISLKEYYPLKEGGYWSFDWEDQRGDKWHGALAVTRMIHEEDYEVFIVTDTTVISGETDVSRSAYMWDREGLKHLYRVTSNGDSTSFRPPRMVIPSKIRRDERSKHEYHYEVYSTNGEKVFSGDVRMEYRLEEAGSVTTRFGKWGDTVIIESIRRDDYPNGTWKTRRQAIWYARGIGPVKIVGGQVGDATGLLIVAK